MIQEKLGKAAVYEEMAVNAYEAATKAFYIARMLRSVRATPEKLKKAELGLVAKLTDMSVYANDLLIETDSERFSNKVGIWFDRLQNENSLRYRYKDTKKAHYILAKAKRIAENRGSVHTDIFLPFTVTTTHVPMILAHENIEKAYICGTLLVIPQP